MGSTSDLGVMQAAVDILKEFDIPVDVDIVSAHRTPDKMFDFARSAHQNGYSVIIAGAGGAAQLGAHALAPHRGNRVHDVQQQSDRSGGRSGGLRHDDPLCLHHPAGGIRRQQAGLGLDGRRRVGQQHGTGTRTEGPLLGGHDLRGGGPRVARAARLLPVDPLWEEELIFAPRSAVPVNC